MNFRQKEIGLYISKNDEMDLDIIGLAAVTILVGDSNSPVFGSVCPSIRLRTEFRNCSSRMSHCLPNAPKASTPSRLLGCSERLSERVF